MSIYSKNFTLNVVASVTCKLKHKDNHLSKSKQYIDMYALVYSPNKDFSCESNIEIYIVFERHDTVSHREF